MRPASWVVSSAFTHAGRHCTTQSSQATASGHAHGQGQGGAAAYNSSPVYKGSARLAFGSFALAPVRQAVAWCQCAMRFSCPVLPYHTMAEPCSSLAQVD